MPVGTELDALRAARSGASSLTALTEAAEEHPLEGARLEQGRLWEGHWLDLSSLSLVGTR